MRPGIRAWPCQSGHAAAPWAFILSTSPAVPSYIPPEAHQRLILHAGSPAKGRWEAGKLGGKAENASGPESEHKDGKLLSWPGSELKTVLTDPAETQIEAVIRFLPKDISHILSICSCYRVNREDSGNRLLKSLLQLGKSESILWIL